MKERENGEDKGVKEEWKPSEGERGTRGEAEKNEREKKRGWRIG